MPEKTRTLIFSREKDTKNTVKFAEVPTEGEAPVIGSLYVQKWFAAGASNVRLTIEAQ